jgi:glutamate/tyrosine decarboxylase-like PLP-dependent enzyme
VDQRRLLHDVADRAADWLEELPDRRVAPERGPGALEITAELQDGPLPAGRVIDDLARESAPGLTAMGSPRFFGFVIGGAHPAGIAADWLATTWDQAAGLAAPTPAASEIDDIAGRWLAELLGLPDGVSFALVTGCQMAHVTALAAARHRVLEQVGHDVERDGLAGAPPIRVVAGAERHVTVDRALRFLGVGTGALEAVAVDDRGAMRADALAEALRSDRDRPTIVAAQVGNVNTGACDDMHAVCAAARETGAWVHVDGAFGLWAAATPTRRSLVAGVELADSWATDAHKWLNVPYDCGVAFVRDREAHRAAMAVTAAYLLQDAEGPREPMDWTPEFSRRARGLAVYATLRALGRDGVSELVERLCACADRFAERLPDAGFEVVSHGLNQVLVACEDDAATDATLAAVQAEGTCWPSATTWRGRRCIRISVCSWLTSFADVDRSVDAMAAALGRVDALRS